MTAAASAVHSAHPGVLIYFSGLDSDFNIEPIVGGSTLLDLTFSFDAASYEWTDKFVLELHEYDEGISSSCTIYDAILILFGFDATTKTGAGTNQAPLVISEWGHDESDASAAYQSNYSVCLTEFMEERQLGWMLWVLAGSYYIRSGTLDYDEPYGKQHSEAWFRVDSDRLANLLLGLLSHTWSGYRGNASLAALEQVIEATYSVYGQ